VSTVAGLTSALANTVVSRIVLSPGTYNLSAELSITRSVILEAALAGSVILNAQANSSSQRRVLNINPGSSDIVQLIGLNITGGYINTGGGVFVARGTVAISSCTISGNRAEGGGGVYVSSGTVTITSSSITGNTASGTDSYGNSAYGGGVVAYGGTVAISSCTISGNTAGQVGSGGGVLVLDGSVTISSCTISGNTAASGSGVFVNGGTVAISSCTISGNQGRWQGAGVYANYATVTITSSSITGNTNSEYVCAHVQNFPSSLGKCLADMPNSTLAHLVLPGICTC
jgi:hypothetical protein